MSGWESAQGRLGPGARWYAGSMGWKVFPVHGIDPHTRSCTCSTAECQTDLKKRGKHPWTSHGHTDATSDVSVVEGWWSNDDRLNPAMSCVASRVLVIDVDPRNGGDIAFAQLEKDLEAEGDGIPDTVEALTGTHTRGSQTIRGRHLYLRMPEDVSGKMRMKLKDYPGIEFKWEGYVVLPPARHYSGVCYEWVAGRAPWETSVARLPKALLDILQHQRRGSGGTFSPGAFNGTTFTMGGEKFDLDKVLEDGVYEGDRVNTIYPMACSLANKYPVDTEHGRAALMSVMMTINRDCFFPPLDEEGHTDTVRAQTERAIRFVLENPKSRLGQIDPGYSAWAGTGVSNIGGGGGGSGEGVDSALIGATSREGHDETVSDVDIQPPWRLKSDGTREWCVRSATDTGNGRRLADWYAERAYKVPGLGWVTWDEVKRRWYVDRERGGVPTRTLALAHEIPTIIRTEISRAGIDRQSDEAAALWAWGQQSKSQARANAAVTQWSTWDHARSSFWDWDSTHEVLAVANGVVDLRTGSLRAMTKNDKITTYSNISYERGLYDQLWARFLEEATCGDKELERWLQLCVGYTLTGLRTYDYFWILHGPPGSGKSTFLDALAGALGDLAMKGPEDVMLSGNRNSTANPEKEIAAMRGKRMLYFSELPLGHRLKENLVKQITGDARLVGRHLYEEPMEFESRTKMWVATNHLPMIRDDAIWRRIFVVPFLNRPGEEDFSLRDYLLDPAGGLPAVLSWGVEGAVRLLSLAKSQRNPFAPVPEIVLEASSRYRKEEDKLGQFIEDELVAESGASAPLGDVFARYNGWSKMNGEEGMTITPFKKLLGDRGVVVTGSGRGALLEGWKLALHSVSSDSDVSWGHLADVSTLHHG